MNQVAGSKLGTPMGPRDPISRGETASYIFEMTRVMAQMAEQHGMQMLPLLLNMSSLEAGEEQGRFPPPSRAETDKH